jgi:hypothetical protein
MQPNTGEILMAYEKHSMLVRTHARQHGDNYQRSLNSPLIPDRIIFSTPWQNHPYLYGADRMRRRNRVVIDARDCFNTHAIARNQCARRRDEGS